MVITLLAHAAVTPAGSPEEVPIPVAPVVEWVILVKAVLTQRVGVEEGAPAVFIALTVMVPDALTLPHPPVSGME